MRISFDLDNVIFDIEPLYKMACDDFNIPYQVPRSWDINKCYPPNVTERLLTLFTMDILYTMPLISAEYPALINQLIDNKNHSVFFVTQRRRAQPAKTFTQLRNAGIHCSRPQVYDRGPQPKINVLTELNPDIHFDDSPNVVTDCLREKIPVTMISNDATPYNHHLRGTVPHYPDLKTALIKNNLLGR